jgi:transposase
MLGCNFVGTPSKLSLFDLFNFIRRRTDMRDLAPTNVARAVALIESGQTYRAVATALGTLKSTINCNVLRYRATGSYDRRRGQGRKRSTTVSNDRFIVLQTLRNRPQTAMQTRSALEEVRECR